MEEQASKMSLKERIIAFYDKHYKALLWIPIIIFVLAIAQIGVQIATTGDFIQKGVSLKGGITVTVPTEELVNLEDVQAKLRTEFPGNDISVRRLEQVGTSVGVTIEADIDGTDETQFEAFLASIESSLGFPLNEDYSVELIGSALGASFFKEVFRAMIIAFVFMAIVVFIVFRSFIPSITAVSCALADIIVTIAIVNLLGIKVSTAGIAGFLMLIGYSIDTDILLTTRMLKRREGKLMDRVTSAFTTGMTMTLTTLVAVGAAFFFTQSEALRQIMLIILIGLVVDIIFTWIQNMAIIRIYLEKKGWAHEHEA